MQPFELYQLAMELSTVRSLYYYYNNIIRMIFIAMVCMADRFMHIEWMPVFQCRSLLSRFHWYTYSYQSTTIIDIIVKV